ncbi:saccharopine dehydrogenase family protein [Microbulbifer sp. 2205BS26-8]|uniref:saccharopine dehydrogenase family protein n=1 Tax=Microbulbifer sp. 2205BS26-8 TaxID=3064386 RepID=UPI002740110D|nr:saccharopine dehydrogenase NADP-binding domain-containing protein [Microbulbifer sp. 2205BS26-8]MDP5208736.1 saccharopine dehydrogenase NADP-binding domain-containing protein [Microbulbifer sp. 2205BS26-8]
MINNLNKRVLILGGYGRLGARIAQMLSVEPEIQLIISGRNKALADRCAKKLGGIAEGLRLQRDAINLAAQLKALHLDLLIHCAGPIQNDSDNRVAKACIESRTPYIDISNARRSVCDFHRLSPAAEAAGIAMVSGAGTLPALSSAALAEIQRELPIIHSVEIAVAPAHYTNCELGTAGTGLKSLGQSFPQLQKGRWHESFSGKHLRPVTLAHPVGKRWLSDSDAPDLELCPRHFPQLHSARFATGLEPRTVQVCLSACAHLIRQHLPLPTTQLAVLGCKLSAHWPGGSPHSGMVVRAGGENRQGESTTKQWQILGLNGDGAWISAAPAVALSRQFLQGNAPKAGAQACWQLLDLDDILMELNNFSVVTALETLTRERLPALTC